MSNKITYLVLFVCFTQLIFSQEFVDQWYNEKDLPQNSVKSIAKDSLGFVWLATESGLARFDGKNFKIFADLDSLSTNRFNFFYKREDSLFARTIYQEDVLITNNQIQKTERRKISKIELPIKHELISEKIGHVLELNQTTSYILPKSEKQLFLKHNELERSFSFKNEISSVINFKDQIYIITKRNFFKINLNEAKLTKINLRNSLNTEEKELNKDKKINFIFDFNQKSIYLNLNKEVYHYCIKKDELTIIHNHLNFTEKNIISAYYDTTEKTAYFGSGYKGFLVSRPNLFTIYKAETPYYVQNLIYAFDVINDGSILTSRGLMFDKQEVKNLSYISGLSSMSMEKIDDFKYAQILSDQIVIIDYKAKGEKQKLIKFEEDLGVLHYDKEKQLLYFSTKKFVSETNIDLYSYNFNTEEISKITSTNHNLNIIDYYDEDKLYVGTENGAYILDLTTDELELINGTSNLNVRNINFQNNYAWISTYNKGLLLKKGGFIHEFPVIVEKVSKSVHHAIEDDFGYLWISTNNGLLRAKVDNLLNESSEEIHFFNYFGTNDGLLTNEFNGGCKPCAIKLESGKILFPSLNGLVEINPEEFLYLNDQIEVIKSTIYINDQEFTSNESLVKLVFPKNTQKIKIEFDYVKTNSIFDFYFSLNKGLPSEIKNDEIVLNNLAPADYSLEFFLPELSKKREIKFSITPKFVQTNQFKILLLFLITLLTYGIIKIIKFTETKRRKQLDLVINEKTKLLRDTISNLTTTSKDLEEKVQSHKKIIASISHDIKSPLQYLKLGAEFLEHELSNKDLGNEVKENVSALNDSIKMLQDFTDNILAYSKAIINQDTSQKEIFNIKDLVSEKIKLFNQVITSKKIDIKLKIDSNLELKTNKNLLAVIIHNVLDNALKNTHKSSITISCKSVFNKVILKIEDKGAGMDESTLNKYRKVFNDTNKKILVSGSGLGLFIVAESSRLIGAEVEIESTKNEGTSFILIIKESN